MSIMNYNEWFHKYHAYLKGTRKNVTSYNDTKWNTISERYDTLIDLMSGLLDDQPFNVVGNYTGFQQLTELMERSNYAYDDIDRSLANTYRMTLQNAMSRMLVNTHCVIANYRFDDKRHVSHDKYGHYYIVDVPFDQLHFGERDEFVRQKLHAFYETESTYFMPSDRFLSNEISKILGFTVICCTNGFMSDDWSVGISEQGFRFKIGWKYSSDVTFTIYKLDESSVMDIVIPINKMKRYAASGFIPISEFDKYGLSGYSRDQLKNWTCVLQISDESSIKNLQIAPNFGTFVQGGLSLKNLQNKTKKDLNTYNAQNVKIRVYVVKYLRELPGVFPAVNYFDMMDTKYVYTEDGSHVSSANGSRVLLQDIHSDEKLPICTPPISLTDWQPNYYAYNTIVKASRIPTELENMIPDINALLNAANTKHPELEPGETEEDYFQTNVLDASREIYNRLIRIESIYTESAILTSLIPMKLIQKFDESVQQFLNLSGTRPEYIYIQSKLFELLIEDNFRAFIKKMCKPLYQAPFSTFGRINHIVEPDKTFPDIHRPVSEQCFMALKYLQDEGMECWVFDVPKIKHFQGIDNVFYIDTQLTGDEVFRFFVLYTDTENPAETNVIETPERFSFDFDIFTKEIDKHLGYIRYWDVENRLFKLTNMFYLKDNPESRIAVLTKVLKNKIAGDVFLEYASEVNYETSNVSSDNLKMYDEYSERAPFAINFLFYTLSLYRGHSDRMQSYLLHMITQSKFYPRYADLPVTKLMDNIVKENVNYSQISYSPISLRVSDKDISVLPDTTDVTLYNGLQFPVRTSEFLPVNPSPNGLIWYPYVFNVYKPEDEHYLMDDMAIDTNYYIKYADPHVEMGDQPETVYFYDSELAAMISVYLSEVYEGINDLTTNYKSRWDQTTEINSLKDVIVRHTAKIESYISARIDTNQFRGQGFEDVVRHFTAGVSSNPIYVKLNQLLSITHDMQGRVYEGSSIGDEYTGTLQTNNQRLLTIIRKTYEQCGFDRNAVWRLRRLYIAMKNLTKKMSLKEYQEALDAIDYMFIIGVHDYPSLDELYADNAENAPYSTTAVHNAVIMFASSVALAKQAAQRMQSQLDSLLSGAIQTDYIDQLVAYCDDVVQNHMFEFFVMDPVKIDETVIGEPLYAEILISSLEAHTWWNITQVGTDSIFIILAKTKYEAVEGGYRITDLIPTCENAFLDGEKLYLTVRIRDASATMIAEFTHVPVTFSKIGNASDVRQKIQKCISHQTIPLEVQNVHETFDVDQDGNIINQRHAKLHYELICGNHFTTLDHFSEYCAPPKNELQGPIDKLYLSCLLINRLATIDELYRPYHNIHFRACEIFHIEPVDDVITSIGGKYFVGQKLYAATDDQLYIFPMIITAIDHSQPRGFIEAKVDLQHTKWFETNSKNVAHKYMTENVTCYIVDDNIRNFLDEYSEYTGEMYAIPSYTNLSEDEVVNLPGDPIYVDANSEYVYTRLNWMFHEEIPDQYNDDIANRTHHFVYIGSASIVTDDADDNFIMVNMINHDFNPYTLPELYNILRDEPDDHAIWHEEIKKFNAEKTIALETIANLDTQIELKKEAIKEATTESERKTLRLQIEDLEYKKKYQEAFIQRLTMYVEQMETPTTWYNVRAYDDALVYINNGRAHLSRTFNPHIQDLTYTDEMEVLLYDWEHKIWLDPNSYTITTNVEDNISIDPLNAYGTNNVMTNITITFNDTTFKSKRILIYFVYNTKDIFDSIELNDMECTVRFEPVISTYNELEQTIADPYGLITIRKHYDENESYQVSKLEPLPIEFDQPNGFIFTRPTRNGVYTDGSPIRFCDMKIVIGQNEYGCDDVEIYIPHIMNDVTVPYEHLELHYSIATNHLNNPLTNGKITLMSVNSDDVSTFHISASSVLFEGVVDDGVITIQSSNLPLTTSHTFTCTILPDKIHPSYGGVFTITVTSVAVSEDTISGWFHLNGYQSDMDIKYNLIPERVAIIMRDGVTLDSSLHVELHNNYRKDTSHDVHPDNIGDDDLFTYYYDKERNVRYPIGHVVNNNHKKRLVIDRTTNETVETIRSNYIGICRYSSHIIPNDGIIDLTGYIPTPLSRDRYEFWVNGRYVYDPTQIVILSPTVIQFRNMISLRNVDIIELVDDIHDNMINKRGPIYVDLNGKIYASFFEMLKHRANVVDQSIQYVFNQDLHTNMDLYLIDPMRRPNNNDYEEDIMTYLTIDDTNDYQELNHIPTTNGETVLNLRTTDLGLSEIPNQELLNKMDMVWKREGLNGITPFKHLARYIDTKGQNQSIHLKETNEGYELYFTGLSELCFTVYISNHSTDDIADRTNVVQIIPMIRPGTRIILDQSLKGKYVHTTIPNPTPIKIV